VTLKKPLDYFKAKESNSSSINNSISELVKNPELNTFSDAFESFKDNLKKIEVLSEFSETLDSYRVNIERVNFLSEKVEDIQSEIQSLLRKEDLDRAMMAQLIVVEATIDDLQHRVRGINENSLSKIRLDVSTLTRSVDQFLEIEVPKYKKLFVDSEIRSDNHMLELKSNISEKINFIEEFVESKYQKILEEIEGINEKTVSDIIRDFSYLNEKFEDLVNNDIPKYKNYIVDAEIKTENKINDFGQNISKTLEEFEANVNETINQNHLNISNDLNILDDKFKKLEENDIPKYKKFIVETEKNLENEKKLNEGIQLKIESLNDKIQQFSDNIELKIESLNEKIIDSDSKTEEIKNQNNSKYIEILEEFKNKINEFKTLKQSVETDFDFQEDLTKKITDLHIEVIRNETHIKVQNKNLQAISDNIKETLEQINLEEIEKQNHDLGKKVKYLEEVFQKFSEREILTETLLVEPPSTDNKDPLTPLDQNFVTLDQLQQHYRLFINRIQQQLATIGGGGETRLEFLDDIDRNSVKQDGYVIQYSSAAGKFIGTSYVSGGGNVAIAITSIAPTSPTAGNLWYDNEIGRTFLYYTDDDGSQWVDANPAGTSGSIQNYWISTNAGIHTTSNVGIGTTNPIEKLSVLGGDIRVGVDTSSGVILTSPNGTKYRLIVNNAGALSTVLVP
jgi:DNA repair exonuclease SbcCD ATPase subunit